MFCQDWFFSPATHDPSSGYFQTFPEDNVEFLHEFDQRIEALEPSNLYQGGWSYIDIQPTRALSEHRSSIYQYAPEELMGASMTSPESGNGSISMSELSSAFAPTQNHKYVDNTTVPLEMYNDTPTTPKVSTTCNFGDGMILTAPFTAIQLSSTSDACADYPQS
jgi:hypothetical protein